MPNTSSKCAEIGIVGLGTMGANLALNFAENSRRVVVFNRTVDKAFSLAKSVADTPAGAFLFPASTLELFVDALEVPRKVLLLVPAGSATESFIEQLTKLLSKGDILVDTGNGHFQDHQKRSAKLEPFGLHFVTMGISGGAAGARNGAAFFPSGQPEVWKHLKPLIEVVAAKAEGDGAPCVTLNGSGGGGACVKMFHNAGEYAVLQIWGETYEFLRAGGLNNSQIAAILQTWKQRKLLDSYMLNITIECVQAKDSDEASSAPLIDFVRDTVGSKGTGLWCVQDALGIGCPAPSLAAAVIARQISMIKDTRLANSSRVKSIHKEVPKTLSLSPESAEIEWLYTAVVLSIITSYAQMYECLRWEDRVHKFGFNLPATISTFRAGCILQGHMVYLIADVFRREPDITNLCCAFEKEIESGIQQFRQLVAVAAVNTTVSIPVISASLNYLNAIFSPLLRSSQLVSLQRDLFGMHGFQRLDKQGDFNHQWPGNPQ